MIRYLTAGESHGPCLIGILEGMPAGLEISEAEIAEDLRRRQLGYGRSERMQIEEDRAKILSGVRYGQTLGAPIALLIENRDWPNWESRMKREAPTDAERAAPLTTPRPGHADYTGSIKYQHQDIRNVIERSSARETAMRVALAAICRKFLREVGISIASHVVQIGGVAATVDASGMATNEINRRADENPVRCLDETAAQQMMEAIDQARSKGDTVGGVFEVVVSGVPPGLGSYAHDDRRLDGVLAKALMSIHAIKAVSFGMGEAVANHLGSEVHDRLQINPSTRWVMRKTNRAGGIEGGMSTGEPMVMRAAMKPLSTLGQPLETIDLRTHQPAVALRERSDVCAVPAAAVVGEAMAMLALMNPFLEKFGGDSIIEIRRHLEVTPGSPWV